MLIFVFAILAIRIVQAANNYALCPAPNQKIQCSGCQLCPDDSLCPMCLSTIPPSEKPYLSSSRMPSFSPAYDLPYAFCPYPFERNQCTGCQYCQDGSLCSLCVTSSTPVRVGTVNPSKHPTIAPSQAPLLIKPQTAASTSIPTLYPTQYPATTNPPVHTETFSPSRGPTIIPTIATSKTQHPSIQPTQQPSQLPTQCPSQLPTQHPSQLPTQHPIVLSLLPTQYPNLLPTLHPTTHSTLQPTPVQYLNNHTASPSSLPAEAPKNETSFPTIIPSISSIAPTLLTRGPTILLKVPPTVSTNAPSAVTTNGNVTSSTKADLNTTLSQNSTILISVIFGSVCLMCSLCILYLYVVNTPGRAAERQEKKISLDAAGDMI